MKKWLAFMLVFILAFVIVGCKDDPIIEDVLVTGVTADVLTKEIAVNEKFIIKATVAPANATNKSVSFASDKVSVATVNSATGEVKGIAPGVAVITVSSSNAKTATVTVTVIEAVKEATSITVKDPSKTIEVSEKYTILATVLPIDAANKTVTFTSSDASVAKVNASTGEVEGLKVGTATIIATTANKLTATVSITVVADSNVLVITNAPAKMAIEEMAELGINLEGTPSWLSKDETVATVDQDGKVTALSAGTVIIEVTLGEAKAQVTILVEVKDDKAFKLTAPEDRTEIAVDFSLTLSAKKGDLILQGSTIFEVTMDPVGAVEYEVLKDSLGTSLHRIRLDAKLAGTVTVKANNGTDVAEYTVKVIARPEPVSFNVTGNTEIELGNKATMRVADVLPLYANRTVSWSSSDETVATIDPETGVVTPVKEGVVIITATYTENPEIKATLEVAIIKEVIIGPVHVEPEEIFINGYESIFIGETYQFMANVTPSGASQDVIWEISPSEKNITINQKGQITGVGLGNANLIVKAEKEDGTFVTARIRITITEAPIVPEPENLGGYIITIMNAEQSLDSYNPFAEGYRGIDKSHKARAWSEVEALYNCDIQVVAYPNNAPWGPLRWDWVNQNANEGTGQADFYILPSDILDEVDASKALYNTKDLYTQFGKNSMGAGFKESITYNGGLYGMSTGTYAENYIDRGLFYNIGLLETLGVENPSQMFLDGNWTFSNFETYVKNVQGLLGEGQFAIGGHPFYYWSGMINAAGIRIADTNKLQLNLDGAVQKQVAKTLRNIVMADAYDLETAWDGDIKSFKNGDSLFVAGDMWFCKAENRWPVNMWGDETTRYGYVPYPHPDNMNPSQTRVASKGQSVQAMANFREHKHRETGASYQGVYRALNEVYLRTSQYMKEDVSLNEQDIRIQNASLKLDDQASIQAVLFYTADKVMFDPFEILMGIHANPLATVAILNVVFNGDDYTAQMDANKASSETALINIFSGN